MSVIRKCKESDIAHVAKFYSDVILWMNDNHVNYPRWNSQVYPNEQSVRTFSEKGDLYLYEDEGRILAAIAMDEIPQGNYRKVQWGRNLPEGSYVTMHAQAVDPDAHEHGVAGRLIRFCIETAIAQGYKAVRIHIAPDNAPSKRLYEKFGFIHVGDMDLEPDIGELTFFSVYELNL